MKKYFIILFSLILAISIGGAGYFLFTGKINYLRSNKEFNSVNLQKDNSQKIDSAVKLVEFYKTNSEFLFLAEIPQNFQVEYVPGLKALNIYDSSLGEENNIENSQIYISFFKSNRFLTLSTVNITKQDKTVISGREAVEYEIEKKPGVVVFLGQPKWRSLRHYAIDVRYNQDSNSYFYSFAKNPNLKQEVFDDFIESLIFLGD